MNAWALNAQRSAALSFQDHTAENTYGCAGLVLELDHGGVQLCIRFNSHDLQIIHRGSHNSDVRMHCRLYLSLITVAVFPVP